ncbi:MobA/MobL family protein, partial [Reticulomyxa filosa]
RRDLLNYKQGDVIRFNSNDERNGIKRGDYYKVLVVSNDKLKLEGDRQSFEWDPKSIPEKSFGRISIYEEEKIKLGIGERIKWTRNNKEKNYIVNGSEAKVIGILENKIKLEMGDGKVVEADLKDKDLKHIDYAYSDTAYSAQGKTADYVIGVLRAREQYISLSTQRSYYVTLSRARHGVKLITNNISHLSKWLATHSGEKSSAIKHQKAGVITKEKEGNRKEFVTPQKQVKVFDRNERYNEFLGNVALIKETASKVFGELNQKLSNNAELRFGNKGSISVNLKSGLWHDFSSGEGGSLYKAYKENNISIGSYEEVKVKETLEQDKLKAVSWLADKTIAIRDSKASLGRKSSETGEYYPGIVSVARDNTGKVKATQTIYLNKEGGKNKELSIVKRSYGVLTGAHVELTNNSKSSRIFIAEGLETALSIAQAQPTARVICSLGISNIKNIELTDKDKELIIVADNDGDNPGTQSAIEKALGIFREQGFKRVDIIKPKEQGKDFNDILKESGVKGINQYIEALDLKTDTNNFNEKATKLQKEIKLHMSTISQEKINGCFSAYESPKAAEHKWDRLVQKDGMIGALRTVEKDPEVLGQIKGFSILNYLGIGMSAREKALDSIEKDLNALYKHSEASQSMQQWHFGKTINKLLKETDNINDDRVTKEVSQKTAESIKDYYERMGIDAQYTNKREYLLRVCYEVLRKEELRKHLQSKINITGIADVKNKEVLEDKLERLMAIDSRLANKDSVFYIPEEINKVLREFNNKEIKLKELAMEYQKQGMEYNKANMIAKEVIKYEGKYGVNIPIKRIERLKAMMSIGNNSNKYIDNRAGSHNLGIQIDYEIKGTNAQEKQIVKANKESQIHDKDIHTAELHKPAPVQQAQRTPSHSIRRDEMDFGM